MLRNKTFVYIYCICLLVFFWRTIVYWSTRVVIGDSMRDVAMYLSLGIMEIISVFVILNRVSFGKKKSGIHWVCLLWFLMMIVVVLSNGDPISAFMKTLFFPLLFGFVFYLIKDNKLNGFILWRQSVVIALGGLYFFLQAMIAKGFGSQSNLVYFVALATPLLLLKDNVKWRNIVLIIVSFIALLSLKRSMMLAIVIFWAVVLLRNMIGRGKAVQGVMGVVLIAILSLLSIKYVDSLSGGYLTARFEMEDMSNGREDIFDNTWQRQKMSTTKHWILGHGHNAVLKQSTGRAISAHNEWLEILYDYGVVMLFVYFCMWVYLIKRWVFHARTNSRYYWGYTFSICIFGVMSMVSQNILYVSYFLYLVIFWAVVEALTDEEYRLWVKNGKNSRLQRIYRNSLLKLNFKG